ncbi:MAG: hypothetical protein EB084_06475 [Proteobacteria bacterium]|nr:hypothetical protein [Pseudomonadota bacterium]
MPPLPFPLPSPSPVPVPFPVPPVPLPPAPLPPGPSSFPLPPAAPSGLPSSVASGGGAELLTMPGSGSAWLLSGVTCGALILSFGGAFAMGLSGRCPGAAAGDPPPDRFDLILLTSAGLRVRRLTFCGVFTVASVFMTSARLTS